jgi:hypothetical protein
MSSKKNQAGEYLAAKENHNGYHWVDQVGISNHHINLTVDHPLRRSTVQTPANHFQQEQ